MAEELGISANAIYLTLKNKRGVSKALREKICQYALLNGYEAKDLPSNKAKMYFFIPEDFDFIRPLEFIIDKLNYRSFQIETISHSSLSFPALTDKKNADLNELCIAKNNTVPFFEFFSDQSDKDAIQFEFLFHIKDAENLDNSILSKNITEEHIRDIDKLMNWRIKNPFASSRRLFFRDHINLRNDSQYIKAKSHNEVLKTKGNILQIAQQLSTSPYSINKVISGENLDPGKNRINILQKANELAYEKIYESKVIKLLYLNEISQTQTNTYKNFFEYLKDELKNFDYEIIITELISSDKNEILATIDSLQPDGLIALLDHEHFVREVSGSLSIPIISIGMISNLMVDTVRTDNSFSFRQLFNFYKQNDIKRLGYFSITKDNSTANEFRINRCKTYCKRNNIEFSKQWTINLLTQGESNGYDLASQGKEIIDKNLAETDFPDAVFCFNDYSALIFSNLINSYKESVLITGWDNDELLKPFIYKPFPSIRADKNEQAYEAINAILERIKHPNKPEKTISIRTKLATVDR